MENSFYFQFILRRPVTVAQFSGVALIVTGIIITRVSDFVSKEDAPGGGGGGGGPSVAPLAAIGLAMISAMVSGTDSSHN